MKRLILAASVLAIAACSQADEADTVEATEEAAPEAVSPVAADGAATAGNYRITTSEGEVYIENVMADGTYTTTNEAGEVVETGTWTQPSSDRYCTTVDEQYRDEGDDGSEKCNTESVDADGVWTSTNSEGRTATVERIES